MIRLLSLSWIGHMFPSMWSDGLRRLIAIAAAGNNAKKEEFKVVKGSTKNREAHDILKHISSMLCFCIFKTKYLITIQFCCNCEQHVFILHTLFPIHCLHLFILNPPWPGWMCSLHFLKSVHTVHTDVFPLKKRLAVYNDMFLFKTNFHKIKTSPLLFDIEKNTSLNQNHVFLPATFKTCKPCVCDPSTMYNSQGYSKTM